GVLHAHRLPRCPRHRRHRDAAVAVPAVAAGTARCVAGRGGRDRRSVLALRRHRVDPHLHDHLPHPLGAAMSAVATEEAHEVTHDDHGHPSDRKYVTIAIILGVLTAMEVATFPAADILGSALIPILMVLMVIK